MSKIINCTQGIQAIVDDEDYEWLNKFKWSIISGYPRRRSKNTEPGGGGKSIMMHRMIMQPMSGFEVDHINGIRNDNRRCNLRLCTSHDNDCNKRKVRGVSKHKGVWFDKSSKKWYSEIKVNGKRIRLGSYDTEDEAGKVYNDSAIEYFGEFANLNIIPDGVNPIKRSQRASFRKTNSTGFIGVFKRESGRYRIVIVINRKHINLGTFNTPEEASEVRNEYLLKRGLI